MIVWLALPLTLLCYWATRQLHQRLRWPIINPVLLPALALMALLYGLELPLADYQLGTRPITLLLEPAVVALAFPLYQQVRQIKRKLVPISIATLSGVLLSLLPTLLIARWLQTDPAMVASVATKAITTPLAMSVSQSLGGIPAIAAALVVLQGILGAVIGYPLFRLARITNLEAQGIAMGACSHAVGTAASAEQGVTQGAFSSLAMVLCGIQTAIVAPILFALFN